MNVRQVSFPGMCFPGVNFGLALSVIMFLVGFLAAAPSARADFKIAAAGDIACPASQAARHVDDQMTKLPHRWKCQGRAVGKLIAREQPLFTLALGDLFQGSNAPSAAYRNFDRDWGVLGDRVMPTPGNHDVYRPRSGPLNFNGYFNYWEAKGAPRWKIGTRDKSWSSWDAGNWHMINLNSNCWVVDCSLTGPQLTWLLRDLQKDRANPRTKCTLAYFHHPLFSTGTYLGRTGNRMLVSNLWELLYRYRADLVLTGHQHYYERHRPQNPSGRRDHTGITQFIVGTGGDSIHNARGPWGIAATNAVASLHSPGAAMFDLGENGFKWKFQSLTGSVIDEAKREVKCHRPNAGYSRRKPRTQRFLKRVKRVRSLKRRAARYSRRSQKLTRTRPVAHHRTPTARKAAKRSMKRTTRRISKRIRRLDQRRLRLERKPLY